MLLEVVCAEARHAHVMHVQLSSAPGGPNATMPAGLCGCERVPEDQCTCDRSLQYLKCVEKRCASGDCSCPASPYREECGALSDTCNAELRLDGCDRSLTTCAGRFHQASDGVIGFTLDDSHLDDQAYCGPFGRCTGELRVITSARRQPPGAFLECVLPAAVGQDHQKGELVHCAHELSEAGVAECGLPMVAQLDPSQEVSGRCYLTDGDGGAKLTKDAWFVVRNRYSEDTSAIATSKTKKRETKKRLKSSARRAREARKAEQDVGEDVEDKKDVDESEASRERSADETGVEREEAEEDVDEAEASRERSAEEADAEHEEASVESRRSSHGLHGRRHSGSKRKRMTPDSNMVIVLIIAIAAIGAALIYLKSKKATS